MSQLYVRTALRMVGSKILTQHDVNAAAWVDQPDTIGVASYTVDIPGPVQTIVHAGEVLNEGALKVPYFCDPDLAPFPLSFRVMIPKRGEVDNLIVPVAISASHVAFNAVRMEPTWMVLGHAAGIAAAMVSASGSLAAEGVGSVNITRLRARLAATGQVLAPRMAPPPTPGPPPQPPLTGDAWYAWVPMWNLTVNTSGADTLIASENGSLLKRSFASSRALPPTEVRVYTAGARVGLWSPPQNASNSQYWLVRVRGPADEPKSHPTPLYTSSNGWPTQTAQN
jgi:hypothetical protein